jgi:hypothetical protein
MSSQNNIASIFICYAHKDNESTDPSQRWLDRLLEQLEPLNLQEQAEIWSDRRIEIGSDWHEDIQATLQQVKAAVLLVSPAFLASKYIQNSELPVLLKRAKEQGVAILPIILRFCQFNERLFKYPDPQNGPEELSLSTLQVANSPTKPLNSLAEHEQDKVLLSVAQRLLKIVNSSAVEQPSESRKTSQPIPSFQNQPEVTLKNEAAIQNWKRKLAFLEQQQAIVAGAAQQFEISEQIAQCKLKIQELEE